MGTKRFKDRDSLHLSAPGWQVLELIFHDMHFRIGDRLTVRAQLDIVIGSRSSIGLATTMIGSGMVSEPERDNVTQQVITDSRGRQKVALSRAGLFTRTGEHRTL